MKLFVDYLVFLSLSLTFFFITQRACSVNKDLFLSLSSLDQSPPFTSSLRIMIHALYSKLVSFRPLNWTDLTYMRMQYVVRLTPIKCVCR